MESINLVPSTTFSKRAGARFTRWLRRAAKNWQCYVLILPAVAAVFIFHYIPIYGVQIAFKDFKASLGFWGSPWVGVEHFRRFLTYPDFWKILKNTALISLYSLATFPCPVILAILLNEVDNPIFKKAVQMITYIPHFISTVVVCSMVLLFLNRDHGLFNNIIAALGVQRVDFITIPGYFRTIYVWSGVWSGIGWGAIIYFAALSNISPELVEAARIDGANKMQTFVQVVLPLVAPGVVATAIYTFINTWNEFLYALILMNNTSKMTVAVALRSLDGAEILDWGDMMAASALVVLPSVIFFCLIQNKIAGGMSEGAVKS